MIVSGCIALAIGTWRTKAGMVPSGRSAACISTLMPVVLTPAFFSTSDRRAPVKRAVPTAPFSHWMPATAGSKNARPLPAHSSVTVIVTAGSFLISSSDSENGEFTSPSTFSVQVAASTCGTGMCERT